MLFKARIICHITALLWSFCTLPDCEAQVTAGFFTRVKHSTNLSYCVIVVIIPCHKTIIHPNRIAQNFLSTQLLSVAFSSTKCNKLFTNLYSTPKLVFFGLTRRVFRAGSITPLRRAITPLELIAPEEDADIKPVHIRAALVRLRNVAQDIFELAYERIDCAPVCVGDCLRCRAV